MALIATVIRTPYPPFPFDETLSPALNVIPFVDPAVGVLVFAAASLLKDTVNRIGDLVDDGVQNKSFKG